MKLSGQQAMTDQFTSKKPRGFATMTPERRKEVSALGGAAVAKEKRSFSTNQELAVEAGRKGGTSARSLKSLLPKA